jgi:hypothetical protein
METIKMLKRDVVGASDGPFNCPVARALKRHFGAVSVSCGFNTARVTIEQGPTTRETRYFDLTAKTRYKIADFEDGLKFTLPHTIKLTETT